MKARLYLDKDDHKGQVLDGQLVHFFMGTEGFNLTLKNGENHKKFLGLFNVVQTQGGEILKNEFVMDPETRLVIQNDESEWIGFKYGKFRIQIFEEEEES